MTPTVSVCVVTYQHAQFIRQTIEGALAQRADFAFEIVIGDDGSTDGTREICLEYAARRPQDLRVSVRDRHPALPGGTAAHVARNFIMTLRELKGEFVALCEGDDYWTDPTKLQRQVEYLRANPDCVGCFHDAKLVDGQGQTLCESYFTSDQEKFSQRDVVASLLSREPTCSLVFRRSALVEPLPGWFLKNPSDLYLDVLLTHHGSLGFMRRNMAAYRKHAGGIWTGTREARQVVELIGRLQGLLAEPAFSEKYAEAIRAKVDGLYSSLFTRNDLDGEVRRLEKIAAEQTEAMRVTQAECHRLAAETADIRREAGRAAAESQQHIDALNKQLALSAEENQASIDALRRQLDQLAATARDQAGHIAVLEKERTRLAALAESQARDSAHYVEVIGEQTRYIELLKQQAARAQPPSGA
jgi:glycosyltransferase involved in cell wall biosynthesis